MSKLIAGFLEAQTSGNHFFSLEFFPPKTPQGMLNMRDRLGRIAPWNPLFSSVTWGTSGSTFSQSIEFASMLKVEFGVEPLLHLSCVNMRQGQIDHALRVAQSKGIYNILVLRGDEPTLVNEIHGEHSSRDGNEKRFSYASELVEYIRNSKEFKSVFTIGVAGHPEGYNNYMDYETELKETEIPSKEKHGPETDSTSTGDNSARESLSRKEKNELKELEMLSNKVNKGADFILSQVFYSSEKFIKWYKRCREYGIKVPIIPTLLPIQTYHSFQRIVKLTGVQVPLELSETLARVSNDDQKVKDVGVIHCIKQIEEIKQATDIIGVHFSTLNLEISLKRILKGAGWGQGLKTETSESEQDCIASKSKHNQGGQAGPCDARSWDEFPNGRFGDARSPAFLSDGMYGQVESINNDLEEFGTPRSDIEMSELFKNFVLGKVGALPWTSDSIGTSSREHTEHLVEMSTKGMWTLASQYAIDGVDSGDVRDGWGPSGGYVYQRTFVECFVRNEIFEKLRKVLVAHKKEITFYAAKVEQDLQAGPGTLQNDGMLRLDTSNIEQDMFEDYKQDTESSSKASEKAEETTVLTWGVFPGTAIVQAALVDKLNFSYWSKEAISIWERWGKLVEQRNKQVGATDKIKEGPPKSAIVGDIKAEGPPKSAIVGDIKAEGPPKAATVGDIKAEGPPKAATVGDIKAEGPPKAATVGDIKAEGPPKAATVGDIKAEGPPKAATVGDIKAEVGDIKAEGPPKAATVGDIKAEGPPKAATVGDIKAEGPPKKTGQSTQNKVMIDSTKDRNEAAKNYHNFLESRHDGGGHWNDPPRQVLNSAASQSKKAQENRVESQSEAGESMTTVIQQFYGVLSRAEEGGVAAAKVVADTRGRIQTLERVIETLPVYAQNILQQMADELRNDNAEGMDVLYSKLVKQDYELGAKWLVGVKRLGGLSIALKKN
ncbi:hypothetical protein BB561_001972 [Smittium simulii]|uniref:MTHFR SAM-binding regulatory domain-containing protein n=1 Tax=Smittium simulii TaxID=133385 RepID=A0A2T9YS85_9FUNG|nr:hypothetical protein BB561_001972 [Smittium simulii]